MGAAIATVFSQGVSAFLCYVYMYRKFDILRGTPKERKYQSKLAKTLLSIGVPMGLQFSITAIGSIMLQSANNALGTACVAAFTSAMRIKCFSFVRWRAWGWLWLPLAVRITVPESLNVSGRGLKPAR